MVAFSSFFLIIIYFGYLEPVMSSHLSVVFTLFCFLLSSATISCSSLLWTAHLNFPSGRHRWAPNKLPKSPASCCAPQPLPLTLQQWPRCVFILSALQRILIRICLCCIQVLYTAFGKSQCIWDSNNLLKYNSSQKNCWVLNDRNVSITISVVFFFLFSLSFWRDFPTQPVPETLQE